MQQKKVKELIKRLAEKYGTTVEEMEKIVRAPTEFVVEVIGKKAVKKELYFPSVRITGLGVFYAKPGRVGFYKKLFEKNEKESEGV